MIQADASLKTSSTRSVKATVTTTKTSEIRAEAKNTPGDVRKRSAS